MFLGMLNAELSEGFGEIETGAETPGGRGKQRPYEVFGERELHPKLHSQPTKYGAFRWAAV